MSAVPPIEPPPAAVADHVVVFAGGDAPLEACVRLVADADRVIAADSGLDHANALGVAAHVLVGDLDSVTAAGREGAVASGLDIVEHPAAKDQTDLELALGLALQHAPKRITVVGGHGGRLDHLLANVALLAAPPLAGVEVRALLGTAVLTVIRTRATLAGRVGELVSLLPVHGAVEGVTTSGLRYPLRDEALAAGSPRGISNELVAPLAVVSLRTGTLVAIQPGALS